MMEENNSKGANQLEAPKKERSAAHPAITIQDALQLTSEIYKNFRSNFAKRSDITAVISGVHPRELAAATYYTLLIRDKDSYQVSDLYKTINAPISETEKKRALLKAFGSPTLNQELISKFDGAEIPAELVFHLSRFHRITEDAAENAATVFLQSADYCGALTHNNVLLYNQTLLKLTEVNVVGLASEPKNEIDPISALINNNKTLLENEPIKAAEIIEKGNSQPPLQIPEMVNEEKVKVRLTENKFAYIIHPININKKDIAVLRKQLDVIEELIT